jgi:hypothetical protein
VWRRHTPARDIGDPAQILGVNGKHTLEGRSGHLVSRWLAQQLPIDQASASGQLPTHRDDRARSSARSASGDLEVSTNEPLVAVALAHGVVTRSGKRSCGPVGLERSVGLQRVTKRVAYASGDGGRGHPFPGLLRRTIGSCRVRIPHSPDPKRERATIE